MADELPQHKIEELCRVALGLGEDPRDAFLAQQAPEVRDAVRATLARAQDATVAYSSPFTPGSQLGQYSIEGGIGQGGGGVVYRGPAGGDQGAVG